MKKRLNKEALMYKPEPLDTAEVNLSPEILGLTEVLARHSHDVWGQRRLEEGWRYGTHRDDSRKEHPCLVPYEDLPEIRLNSLVDVPQP